MLPNEGRVDKRGARDEKIAPTKAATKQRGVLFSTAGVAFVAALLASLPLAFAVSGPLTHGWEYGERQEEPVGPTTRSDMSERAAAHSVRDCDTGP